jgi:hypothetical protein
MPMLICPEFLGQIEIFVIFCLAKILRPKSSGRQTIWRLFRCLANEFNCAREILLRSGRSASG